MISLSNKVATVVLLSALLVTGLSVVQAAVDEHAAHHPAADGKVATDTATTPAAAPTDTMTNMKKMQGQMSAIRATKDPKERAKLMDEHMKTMQNTMQMMQQEKDCMMMGDGGMNRGMMKDGESAGGMSMMQGMMEQMMQHQKAMQGTDK
jgi:hypothetical protein